MNTLFLFGVLLTCADPASTDNSPLLVQSLGLTSDDLAYVSSCEMERESHIKSLRNQLQTLKSKRFASHAREVAAIKHELKDWETHHIIRLCEIKRMSLGMPASGEFSNSVKIVQIASGTEALIKTDIGELAWLSGFDMTKHVDDENIMLHGCVVIDSTKQYTTVLGATKTIYVVRKPTIDSGRVAAMFKALNEIDEEATASTAEKLQRLKAGAWGQRLLRSRQKRPPRKNMAHCFQMQNV